MQSEELQNKNCYDWDKELKEMEWITRLNAAMDYLESNLTGEVDYETLAQRACCSTYHFQRMFSYMAGVPLGEYVRRRRMSLAAADLLAGERVLEVAAKYGYESPTAFNRAFQSVHGFAPTQAKEPGVNLTSFLPISFQMTIKGATAMNYRIEKKEAFRIVGVGTPMEKEMELNFQTVPKLWNEVATNGSLSRLMPLMKDAPMGVMGISACTKDDDWRYYIAVANASDDPGEFETYEVGAFTWAIFPGEGTMPTSVQELEKRIITEWLPSSGYEYDNGPDIELYFNADPQNAKFEIWIPVVKK